MDLDALPHTPLKTAPSTNQEAHSFIESPERLILKPGMLAPIVMVGFAIAMIIFFTPIGIGQGGDVPHGFGYAILVFMSIFGLIGFFAGLAVYSWSMRATFDLVGGELLVKGLRFRDGLRVQLRDVVALQIVLGRAANPGEASASSPCELNVVWKQNDAIERTCLLHHIGDKTIRRIAGRTAERIGVPVVEHSVDAKDAPPRT